MSARQQFRDILAAPGLALMPGAYDGLSARIIEEQGFGALIAGGYAAAGSLLGQPDTGQSNMRDFADHYARICDAVSIPVYADGDTGFGGVHNVTQLVKAFEKAGVAALFFTDQVFPSRCGYLPGKQVVETSAMLAKLKAALDARSDERMMICARTDVFALEGEDEAIHRCQLFMEAGADLAKPQGIDTQDGIRRVLRDVPGPFIATLSQAAGPAHMTPDQLETLGVNAATLPSLPLFAAAKAVRDALRELQRTRSVAAVQDRLLPLDEYYKVVQLDEQWAREKTYDDEAARLVRDAK
ncbi:MAG: isocitrate lyase and phosphorylmutase [Hyphomicrobiales bacterium]|nr:isocitrate lyase and phosphorylmutase [Hyphomicrobiales bacterium]